MAEAQALGHPALGAIVLETLAINCQKLGRKSGEVGANSADHKNIELDLRRRQGLVGLGCYRTVGTPMCLHGVSVHTNGDAHQEGEKRSASVKGSSCPLAKSPDERLLYDIIRLDSMLGAGASLFDDPKQSLAVATINCGNCDRIALPEALNERACPLRGVPRGRSFRAHQRGSYCDMHANVNLRVKALNRA